MPAKQHRKPHLSAVQIERIGQFNDYSFEYPGLTFDEVVKKVLGPRPFPNTPTGREFEREAREVFDREREKL